VQLIEHGVGADRAVAHVSLLEHYERSLHGGPAVAVARWPDDAERITELRRARTPRLILVGSADDPIVPSDDLEDWLRLPVDDRDARVRILRLRDRAHRAPPQPVLDGQGRLLYSDRWVGLSGVEERLAGPLVARFGDVVRYAELLEAGWPGQSKGKNALRPRISGLRRRVQTIGLELRSIREVGHVLEPLTRPLV